MTDTSPQPDAAPPTAHRRTLSLRDRLGLGLAAVGAISIVVAIIVSLTTQQFLLSQMDDRLDSYAGPSFYDQPIQQLPDRFQQFQDDERLSEATRGYVDADGNLYVLVAPNVDGAVDEVPAIPLHKLTDESAHFTAHSTDGSTKFRVLARPAGSGWDITALPLDDVTAATQRLILIEGIGIVLLIGTLGLVAWWVNRLGITPMRRMVDASTQIAHGDLDVRLNTDQGGTETNELAESLNAMIGTLTDSLREREKSETRLREFVADASHELRTPLTTVLGYSELHKRGALADSDAQNDAWARTEAEAARMRRLVEDMLTLAKYDAEPDLEQRDIHLGDLATSVVADATVAYPDTTFEFGGGTATVNADGDRLRQALLNVVANAAVHGGDTVTVTVTSDDADARVIVHDNGAGMTPEVAARATERFVRGDSSRHRATGGAGLGLAITAAIVDAHHGTLTVESTADDGTTITITVPHATPAT
ncbi:HAMP domain-containing histidine kinase [Demequina sp. B12]|uniref:sensor histidine kinase n=1 Tax=Demequina sp. B12 TaxID=2992757 RepID=UPI00237B973E|nr:HAMP domain-containing sensor histidine kinase [Demequina sp. B12]MDE0572221.1 HAMP domain-containing histidine kinase [Demequina sp. B12]